MRIGKAVLTLLLASAMGPAWAADVPVPKVMRGVPANDGKWKMEMLDAPGMPREARQNAAGMRGMTVCTTAAKAWAADSRAKSDCSGKLVEDGDNRAVMELRCPSSGTAIRNTMVRAGAGSYEVTVQDLKQPGQPPMRMRMSYLGPCSAKESVIGFEKNSDTCRQMRARLPDIRQARASCARGGSGRAACERSIDRQVADIQAMCGGK
ncbi:DUF3617 domain-containing protein [Thermomonas flagellata]|uniref:DUF3617 domain-containing protein n=1 Tax=Thermomonas flagellata TaxID=2888524 RepID=UPI001F03EF06|nr:DUF3617 family protein [Thermomonas flagellata]